MGTGMGKQKAQVLPPGKGMSQPTSYSPPHRPWTVPLHPLSLSIARPFAIPMHGIFLPPTFTSQWGCFHFLLTY